MTASKVDAIQAAVLKAARAAIAEYRKRNPHPKADKKHPEHDPKAVNEPPREFVEKIIRSRIETGALVKAFVDDALAAVGE